MNILQNSNMNILVYRESELFAIIFQNFNKKKQLNLLVFLRFGLTERFHIFIFFVLDNTNPVCFINSMINFTEMSCTDKNCFLNATINSLLKYMEVELRVQWKLYDKLDMHNILLYNCVFIISNYYLNSS